MAIVENPFIGRASGKLGNTVFYTQWEQNIVRTQSIDPKNPKTPAQMFNRGRFKMIRALVPQVLYYINAAYARSLKTTAPYNRIISINMKECFVDGTDSIDPSLFKLCEHDGSFVNNVVLSSTDANTISGTFDSNAQNADEDADPVKAYGFDVDGNKIWWFGQESIRSTGTITLSHSDMSGLDIAVYFECLDRVNLIEGKPKHVIKYVGTVKVS
jgi:hypothetical protein